MDRFKFMRGFIITCFSIVASWIIILSNHHYNNIATNIMLGLAMGSGMTSLFLFFFGT